MYWGVLGAEPPVVDFIKVQPDKPGGKLATLSGDIKIVLDPNPYIKLAGNDRYPGHVKLDSLKLVRNHPNSNKWYLPEDELRRVVGLVGVTMPVTQTENQTLPRDVPPVMGTAIFVPAVEQKDDLEWSIRLAVPKVAWQIVDKFQPKKQWPSLKVTVQESTLELQMGHHPESQLSGSVQNWILDFNGKKLNRDEARRRLSVKNASTRVGFRQYARSFLPAMHETGHPHRNTGNPSLSGPQWLPCRAVTE